MVKHLLVHVDSTPRSEERLGLALAVARRHGARVTGLFAELETMGGSLVARRTPDQVHEAARAAQARFGAAVAAAGAPSAWWTLAGAEPSDLVGRFVTCARYADLAVLGQPEEHGRMPHYLVDQVVLESGRPALVVPSSGRHPDAGHRVAVGWNASRESARALHDAMPFLRAAEQVGLLAFQRAAGEGEEPGGPHPDVMELLALHGVRARYERAMADPHGIGLAGVLMNHAFDTQADLVVLGARAEGFPVKHLGEVAREYLRSMATPVLFAA
ncbi:MAG: universal stress protein [Deltaproteobacteria bacterium]|nr:universal stress protein [Deltaproteobacteria bacterium]